MFDKELTIKQIIDCAYRVRKGLSHGYLEKVYENALMIELANADISAQRQVPLNVVYNDQVVGEYIADIVVEQQIIVEVKAVKNIDTSHETQLVNYLTTTGIDDGLIVNFGNPEKIQIKRKYRTYISK